MRIVWSPEARDDLDEIYRFIAERNPLAAAKLHRHLVERTRHLESHPEQGKPRPESHCRELRLAGYPYRIFYRVGKQTVDVVRILHSARDVPVPLS